MSLSQWDSANKNKVRKKRDVKRNFKSSLENKIPHQIWQNLIQL